MSKLENENSMIIIVEVGDIDLYKERWKAVEETQRQNVITSMDCQTVYRLEG